MLNNKDKYRLNELTKLIKNVKHEMHSFEEQANEIAKRYIHNTNLPLWQRYDLWEKHSIKKHQYWIISEGDFRCFRKLLDSMPDPERYETIEIVDFVNEHLYEYATTEDSHYNIEDYEIHWTSTIASLEECLCLKARTIMAIEEVITNNIESFTYDW